MRRPAAHHQHHHIYQKCIFFKVVVVAENTYAIVQEKNENVLFQTTFGKEETRDSCRI